MTLSELFSHALKYKRVVSVFLCTFNIFRVRGANAFAMSLDTFQASLSFILFYVCVFVCVRLKCEREGREEEKCAFHTGFFCIE